MIRYIECTDDELIREYCARGDHDAFTELATRYSPLIRRLLVVLLHGHGEDIEDAEQEVLVRLYLNLRKFSKRSAFSTYLTRVVRNAAIDEIRKHDRHRRISKRLLELTPDPENADNAERTYFRSFEQSRVIDALDGLDPDERLVLYLKDAEGQTMQHIAKALGKPLGSVKSKLFRTRRKFATRYKEITDDAEERQ